MSGTAMVAVTSAPSRSGGAAHWATSTSAVHTVAASKTKESTKQSVGNQHTVTGTSTDTATDPHLPLGLLLSVTAPDTGNTSASYDYSAMEIALRTDNLAAAQQAYMRLQSDLQGVHTKASGNQSTKQSQHSSLNVVA